jgi:hypothetical protein
MIILVALSLRKTLLTLMILFKEANHFHLEQHSCQMESYMGFWLYRVFQTKE